jgi:hypothetical protein
MKKLTFAVDLAVLSDHAKAVRIALGRVVERRNRNVEIKPVRSFWVYAHSDNVRELLLGSDTGPRTKHARGESE